MKKTNLLIIIGLSLVIGGSALNITANFNNDQIKTTNPKRANDTTNFELKPTLQNEITESHYFNNSSLYSYTLKSEYKGQNQALHIRSESIIQTGIGESSMGNQVIMTNNPESTIYTTMLFKHQITPYRYLYNTEIETNVYTTLRLRLNTFIGSNEQELETIKLKITTLTTSEDWTSYLNQSNYYVEGQNAKIIEEIKDPNNQQKYNEEIEILEIEIKNYSSTQYIDIISEIPIISGNNEYRTNYAFTLIQPYTTNLEYPNYIGLNNASGAIWGKLDGETPITIKGQMIPPITNYEVIDIPSLMFNILTMPFAFISTAFNLTLFPGTPYQINISNLFLTILAILIFVFIVKIFVNMKG